jgi:hypothetical protein
MLGKIQPNKLSIKSWISNEILENKVSEGSKRYQTLPQTFKKHGKASNFQKF